MYLCFKKRGLQSINQLIYPMQAIKGVIILYLLVKGGGCPKSNICFLQKGFNFCVTGIHRIPQSLSISFNKSVDYGVLINQS